MFGGNTICNLWAAPSITANRLAKVGSSFPVTLSLLYDNSALVRLGIIVTNVGKLCLHLVLFVFYVNNLLCDWSMYIVIHRIQ